MALFNQNFASEPALVGNSPRLRHVQRMVDKLASGRWPALILGETGTGKEVVSLSISGPTNDEQSMVTKGPTGLAE